MNRFPEIERLRDLLLSVNFYLRKLAPLFIGTVKNFCKLFSLKVCYFKNRCISFHKSLKRKPSHSLIYYDSISYMALQAKKIVLKHHLFFWPTFQRNLKSNINSTIHEKNDMSTFHLKNNTRGSALQQVARKGLSSWFQSLTW